jgi:predicted secreted protein
VIFMARRLLAYGFLSILFLAMVTGSVAAQSSSNASSSASSVNGLVDVRLGGLVFETGAWVALEFVRDSNVDCFGAGVTVQQLELLDAQQEPVSSTVYDPAVPIDGWLGRIQLVDLDGQPLPTGTYRLVVATSVGTFSAEIEVVDASRFDRLGRYSASATVCGLSLRVYRLVTEADSGARVTLRVGDRLLVLLAGNPTTGYEWSNTLLYEYASLREIEEAEFRSESDLIGAGGLFLFRYEAVDVGSQAFRFAYQRPWESVQPLQIFEFSADVRGAV